MPVLWIFSRAISLPEVNHCAVQHGLNEAFGGVKPGEFYQMIKVIADLVFCAAWHLCDVISRKSFHEI
jgi:hypothetical protein